MNYELSAHAAKRMRERRIATEWLEHTLDHPDLTEEDGLDPAMVHHLAVIAASGSKVLRVVLDPRANPIRIVTVHFDRSMRGKL